MSTHMKRSVIHFSLWFIITIFFAVIFFSENTIEQWGDNPIKMMHLAILFGVGILSDMILRWLFQKRKYQRDDTVRHQAASHGFIVTILYVFMVSMIIYIKYEQSGLVPVAWLWFIAYSLILVANVSTAFLAIIYDRMQVSDE